MFIFNTHFVWAGSVMSVLLQLAGVKGLIWLSLSSSWTKPGSCWTAAQCQWKWCSLALSQKPCVHVYCKFYLVFGLECAYMLEITVCQGHPIPDIFRFHVLITTYEVIISDLEQLRKVDWRVAIIDEAHRLKNRNCKLLQGLSCFDVVCTENSQPSVLHCITKLVKMYCVRNKDTACYFAISVTHKLVAPYGVKHYFFNAE